MQAEPDWRRGAVGGPCRREQGGSRRAQLAALRSPPRLIRIRVVKPPLRGILSSRVDGESIPALLGAPSCRLNGDVEVQDILPNAQLGIESYGRFVDVVRLDIDDVSTHVARQALQ